MILFNKPSITEKEIEYVTDSLMNGRLSGDGGYTKRVYDRMTELFGFSDMLLTTSGTTSLEMAAILSGIEPGDEVIVPSFTFSSTVNAFLLRHAKPVFCDVRPDTMNIDENKIEDLITDRTKVICTVDYAGVPCEYDRIEQIAADHGLFLVEDAAQGVGSTYHGKPLGTFGSLGCYSFHETKNYVAGEGGMLIVNDPALMDRAEIIREKGTNRSQLLKGMVDKYTWHDVGGSYLPSDILSALLLAQLERFQKIMDKRMLVWDTYQEGLVELEEAGYLRRLTVPEGVTHNAHMYNIVLESDAVRTELSARLREKGIPAYICYVPLHSSPMGQKLGYKAEDCPLTEEYGNRILRLPLHSQMSRDDAAYVVSEIGKAMKAM